jgi:hypothetical protein
LQFSRDREVPVPFFNTLLRERVDESKGPNLDSPRGLSRFPTSHPDSSAFRFRLSALRFILHAMDGALLPVLLVAIVAVGTAGVYLLLRDPTGLSTLQPVRRFDPFNRRIGGALAGVSLLALLAFFGMSADWWPESRLTPTPAFAAWTLLSMTSVAAAVVTITAPNTRTAALSFGAMLAANAGLFLFQQHAWLAAAAAVCCGVGLAVVWRAPWEAIERLAADRAAGFSREPFLACVAGGILTVALIGTVRFALATPATGIEDRRSRIEDRQGQATGARRSGLFGRPSSTESHVDADGEGLIAAAIHEHRISLVLLATLVLTTTAGVKLVVGRARVQPPLESVRGPAGGDRRQAVSNSTND